MKKLTLLSFLLTVCLIGITQQKKQLPNLAVIQTTDGKKIKGWYYAVREDSVLLLPLPTRSFSPRDLNKLEGSGRMLSFNIAQIEKIGLAKKNRVLKGALIGMGVGVVSGYIMGLSQGDDPIEPYTGNPFEDVIIAVQNGLAMSAQQKAAGGAIVFGFTGTVVGVVLGLVAKKNFVINGKREHFEDKESQLMKRLLIK